MDAMAQEFWTPMSPWVPRVAKEKVLSILEHVPRGATVFVLDEASMRSRNDLFAEFAPKMLSFPDYFGGNWAALLDCLEDMTLAPPADSYLIVINDWKSVSLNARVTNQYWRGTLNEVGSRWAMEAAGRVPFSSLLVGLC
jgi:RNAse (barnase) inhibitor barstar